MTVVTIGSVYLAWAALTSVMYFILGKRHAMWLALLGGWAFLPPAAYPEVGVPPGFPWWIIAGGLPSDIWLNKAWAAPLIALAGSLLFDCKRWRGFTWHWTDASLAAFCFWPILQVTIVGPVNPAAWQSGAFLAGVWAVPWLLGRVYLTTREDAIAFVEVLVMTGLTLLPVAAFEGISPQRLHSALLGAHPFVRDGAERYLGFRPQAMFENGNQYGLWAAATAIAGFWRFKQAQSNGESAGRWKIIAIVLVLMTIAAQSMSAVLLMALGVTLIGFPQLFHLLFRGAPLGLLAAALLATVHVSGVLPVRSLIENSALGQKAIGALRASGRGSLAWRFGQDFKTLPEIRSKLIVGTGKWDWFRPRKTRPWGLPLLVLGQFGLVGLSLLGMALLGALYRNISLARSAFAPHASAYSAFLLLFAIDALLNSFLFYPAIAVAGAMVTIRRSERQNKPA